MENSREAAFDGSIYFFQTFTGRIFVVFAYVKRKKILVLNGRNIIALEGLNKRL